MRYRVVYQAGLSFLGIFVVPIVVGLVGALTGGLVFASQGLNIQPLLPFLLLYGPVLGFLYGAPPAILTMLICFGLAKDKSISFRQIWATSTMASIPTTILVTWSWEKRLSDPLPLVAVIMIFATLATAIAWLIAKRSKLIVPMG